MRILAKQVEGIRGQSQMMSQLTEREGILQIAVVVRDVVIFPGQMRIKREMRGANVVYVLHGNPFRTA